MNDMDESFCGIIVLIIAIFLVCMTVIMLFVGCTHDKKEKPKIQYRYGYIEKVVGDEDNYVHSIRLKEGDGITLGIGHHSIWSSLNKGDYIQFYVDDRQVIRFEKLLKPSE
tara:strand:- start:43008 stop:43340 length:333 start_codon:yes stop_codon:yes gene_type:complete